MKVSHNIPPVFRFDSRVLILGSFPSVSSREEGFFYGNVHNRFYKVLSKIREEECPKTIPEKKDFLIRNHIALFDVVASCEVTGSSDSSIKNVIPNDINALLSKCDIRCIFLNGKTAAKLYEKYINLPLQTYIMPSTSPANAAYSLEKLALSWSKINEFL